MLIDCMAFVYPVTLPFSQWNPDQWVALVKTAVWPVFWAVMVVGWRSRVGELLDAITVVIRGSDEISVGPVKVVRTKPEQVRDVKIEPEEQITPFTGGDRLDTISLIRAIPEVSAETSARPLIKERLTRLTVVKQETDRSS